MGINALIIFASTIPVFAATLGGVYLSKRLRAIKSLALKASRESMHVRDLNRQLNELTLRQRQFERFLVNLSNEYRGCIQTLTKDVSILTNLLAQNNESDLELSARISRLEGENA